MIMMIRKMQKSDAAAVFDLMKKLAIFEKYIDEFAIDVDVVKHSGFDKDVPDFHALVADDDGVIVGMLVYYFLPYTAQNRPAIYMKELYVDEHARNQKVGEKLMNALKQQAIEHHCTTIKWTVAPWNEGGMRFYERLGARQNNDWINYELTIGDGLSGDP